MEKKFNYDLNVLLSETESEYLDFKLKYHDNKAKLVHDILCLANADTENNRYLIFGISDDNDIMGVNEDDNRREQSNIIDLLKNSNFNLTPEVRLDPHDYKGHKIDVLIIENLDKKPYFLIKDKREGNTTVRAGVIYTRIGDTNTPINSTAEDHAIEKMYRERFGFNLPPKDRFLKFLKDKENWSYIESQEIEFHYKPFPEFNILMRDTNQEFKEPWVEGFPDPKTVRCFLQMKYQGVNINNEIIAVFLDGCRMLELIPSQKVINLSETITRVYYFFEKGTLNYLLQQMILKVYPQHQTFYMGCPYNTFDENEDSIFEIEEHSKGNSGRELVYFQKTPDGRYERQQN